MNGVTRKATLSPARQRLTELMQGLQFGRIEGLEVRSGEPVFDPPPHLIRDVKFGAENGRRPESALNDFALKVPVRELFAHLDTHGEGTIRRLEVKHGLPFRMFMEEVTAA